MLGPPCLCSYEMTRDSDELERTWLLQFEVWLQVNTYLAALHSVTERRFMLTVVLSDHGIWVFVFA